MEHEMVARVGDSIARWHVSSRTREDIEHLVDIYAYGGNGRCTCEHFTMRIEPTLRDGSRRGGRRATRCSHILVARESYTDAMIQWGIQQKRERAQRDAKQTNTEADVH